MLEEIFADRDDYLVLKMPATFPSFTVGSDVDILCQNMYEFAEHILELHPDGKTLVRGKHLQVDLKWNGELIIKFDLIESLGEYDLKAEEVFGRSVWVRRRDRKYRVPCRKDELQIRLVEYKKNRHKTWHRDFIEKYGEVGLLSSLESRVKIQV